MLLIVSATEMEIKSFIHLKNKFNNLKFLVCGIGLVNSIWNVTQFLLKNKKIKKVLLTGICGGFRDKTEIGEILIANEEILGDFGVCFNEKVEYFNSNKIKIMGKYNLPYKKGAFLTVNCVTTNKDRIEFYKKKFSPISENMEGYGIAYICNKLDIEFIEIRAVSNFVGDRKFWNIKLALENLKNESKKIIERICES